MKQGLICEFLFSELRSGKDITITVSGTSMNPIMNNGDLVTVHYDATYSIGDVLVFIYKGELLIHRLIKIAKDRLFCKGDNSFRLEDLAIEDVAGKVILLNGERVPIFSNDFVNLSYLVNREFRKCGYDIEKTKESGIYRFYHECIWGNKCRTLKYRLKQPISSILLQEMLPPAYKLQPSTESLCRDARDNYITHMSEFCDYDTLIKCFSQFDTPASMDVEAVVHHFLMKGIIAQLLEVV